MPVATTSRHDGSGRVALAVARQGSHRSGRACINASGSSNQQLRHPRGSPKLFNQVTWTCWGTSMCSACFPRLSLLADASLSSTGSSRASSPASSVLSKRYDALLPSRRTSFPSLGGTSAFTRCVRSLADECAAKAWSWYPGVSNRGVAEEATGSPKFLGNLDGPFAMFQTDAGRTACTRPLQCSSVALGHRKAKAPTKGLSALNSMAFGLAVYASQCGLLQHHARLASSCWSGSTGRAFHPQGSDERFQSCRLHLIPLSQACLAQSM